MAKQEARAVGHGDSGTAKFQSTPQSITLEFTSQSSDEPSLKVEWRGKFPIRRAALDGLSQGHNPGVQNGDLAAIITQGSSALEMRGTKLKLNGSDANLNDDEVKSILRDLHERWAAMASAGEGSPQSTSQQSSATLEAYSDETTEDSPGSGVLDAVCAVAAVGAGLSAITFNPVGAAIWGPPALACAIHYVRGGGGGAKKDGGGKPPLDTVLEP